MREKTKTLITNWAEPRGLDKSQYLTMELSIIILNFNTLDLTLNCLSSIVNEYKEELANKKFEIILVDNGSTDGSLEKFKKLDILGLKIIESKKNLGFSKGCNLGAKKAKGENLLFLNSDTEIKDQGFIKMLDFLSKNEKIGIIGAKLKNTDGTSQGSVGKFYNFFNLFFWQLGFERLGLLRESPNETKQVDWVSGACLLIRRKVFEKVKGFEEELFMYFEDIELCFKVKKIGFLTYFYPEVTLYHKSLGSSNRTFAILNIYKGILFFYKKHKSGFEYFLVRFMLFSKAWILTVIGKVTNNKYYLDTYGKTLEIF